MGMPNTCQGVPGSSQARQSKGHVMHRLRGFHGAVVITTNAATTLPHLLTPLVPSPQSKVPLAEFSRFLKATPLPSFAKFSSFLGILACLRTTTRSFQARQTWSKAQSRAAVFRRTTKGARCHRFQHAQTPFSQQTQASLSGPSDSSMLLVSRAAAIASECCAPSYHSNDC
ncbi:hypothetical protein BKA80DRAFT_20590 [Phyllosticta citrichinensis]